MFAVMMTAEWMAWIAELSQPLHRRLAGKLVNVVAGVLFASGRRTASSWWRAAGVGTNFRSYYYFLDALGRKVSEVRRIAKSLTQSAHESQRLPGFPSEMICSGADREVFGQSWDQPQDR